MRTATIRRDTKETQIRGPPLDRGPRPLRHLDRHPLPGPHARAVREARRLRPDAEGRRAIWTSISTTRWKTSASCWVSCSPRRSATGAASTAPATSSCPWTKPWRWWRIDLGGRPALVYKDLVQDAPGRRSSSRTGRGFLRRLRDPGGRQRPREGAVRALQPSQAGGRLQVLRARAEVRLLEGQAAARASCRRPRDCYDRHLRLRRRQSSLGGKHAGRGRRRVHAGARRGGAARRRRRSSCRASATSARSCGRSTRWRCATRSSSGSRPACRSSASASACRRCSRRAKKRPDVRGLGLIDGTVRRFPETARVPHMGWNELEPRKPSRLLAGVRPRPVRLLRAQLLCARDRGDRGHLHLHAALHGAARRRQHCSACSFIRRSRGRWASPS